MTTAATKLQKSDSPPSEHDGSEGTCVPRTDITESDNAFVFCAEVPGVKPGDVDVSFDDGILTLHGKVVRRQAPDQAYAEREYSVADFHRAFVIEAPVAADRITANLQDGLLTVTVPKTESARRRKIEVKTT